MRRTDRYFLLRLFEYLAWGAEVGVPLDEALRAAAGEHLPTAFANGTACYMLDSGTLALLQALGDSLLPWRRSCRQGIAKAARDVHDGLRLSDTLARHLGRWLPPDILPLLRHAEEHGSLPQALRLADQRMRARDDVRCRLTKDIKLALRYVLVTATVIAGMAIFIFPKFAYMYQEMLDGYRLPRLMDACNGVANAVLRNAGVVVLGALGLWVLVIILWRQRPVRRLAITICAWLPVGRTVVHTLWLDETAGLLQVALAQQRPLPEAIASARAVATHPHLAQRLARMEAAVTRGESWPVAWQELRLGPPLATWLATNGMACQEPATAMAQISAHCQERLRHWAFLANTLTLPLITFGQAIMVGSFVVATLLTLWTMLDAIAGGM